MDELMMMENEGRQRKRNEITKVRGFGYG